MGTGRGQKLTRRVAQTAQRYGLLGQEKRIVVGLSGGSDSTALLYILHFLRQQFPYRIVAAHLHHGMRGTDADADAAFCAELAAVLHIRLETARVPVPLIAERRGISLEMAARECRHRFFHEICRRERTRTVVLAHTADDQAETVLMKLCRGGGIEGIAGMPYEAHIGELRIVRPLLDIDRNELRAFLDAHRLAWREDPSNADCRHLRNRVRHIVLPCIAEQMNPNIRRTLSRTARLMQDENEYLESLSDAHYRRVQSAKNPNELNAAALRKQPAGLRRRILRRWVREHSRKAADMNFDTTYTLDRMVCRAAGSAHIHLETGEIVVVEYDRMYLVRKKSAEKAFSCSLPPGEHLFTALGLRVRVNSSNRLEKAPPGKPGEWPAEASLDRRVLDGRLRMRSFRPGDRIFPTGMKGSRKVKDVFIDAKLPRDQRARLPIFTHGGRIVWVPGYRVDRRFAVREPGEPCARVSVQAIE